MNLFKHIKKSYLHSNKRILYTPNASYSFQEIDQHSLRISKILLKLGMQPGDRLIAQIDKSEYNLFLYLACLRSRIIYVPLNNTYTAAELDYFFEDVIPRVIICTSISEKKNKKHSEY